jgi:hypothetical protein
MDRRHLRDQPLQVCWNARTSRAFDFHLPKQPKGLSKTQYGGMAQWSMAVVLKAHWGDLRDSRISA